MDDTTTAKILELYQLETQIDASRKALHDCQNKARTLKQELGRKLSLVAPQGSILLIPELVAKNQAVWVDDHRSDDPISFVELAHL